MKTKTRSDALEAKINNAQFSQLVLWLGQHSYQKVQQLIAADPPNGFGIKTSTTSIFRFYKAHEEEIKNKRLEQIALSAEVIGASSRREHFTEATLAGASKWLVKESVFLRLRQHIPSALELQRLANLAGNHQGF